jgi:RHS repeat-associated protein
MSKSFQRIAFLVLLISLCATTAHSQALPPSWSHSDVGSVGIAGSASYSNGVFTVTATGQSIGGTTDAMHFVDQSLSGDGTIVARVVSLSGLASAQAGVMIRETLGATSTHAFAEATQYSGYFLYRATTGGSTVSSTSITVALPYWVKAVRSGSTFSAYASSDGVNWLQMGTSQTISMATNVYIGLAVSGDSNTTAATATFDNVSISSTASPAPTISSVSATTGSVGSQVTIKGTNFGSSQGSSHVYLNALAATIQSWTSTTIVFTVPTGATSGYLGVTVAPSLNNSNTIRFSVTTHPLPTTWLDQDVGQVGLVGSATYQSGAFTIVASGQTIRGTADQMHFVYQPLSGDGTILARVVSLTGNTSVQAGVMIRETLDTSSTNVYSYSTPYSSYFAYRPSTGASTTSSSATTITLPCWVKAVRSGTTFSGYTSSDGVNWVQMGTSQTITMATNAYIGLAVSSDDNASTATAVLDSVSVNSTTTPAPVISNLSSTTGSVGTQVVITGLNFGSSQGNSLVLLNDSPVTIDYWSATAITITLPTGATSGPFVVSVAPNMDDSNPVDFEVTNQPLPLPWLNQDVGPVGLTGSATYTNGAFTVNGAGLSIRGTSDGMHFVYRPVSGDVTIIARVTNLSGGFNPEAGVMIRETLDPSASDTFIFFQPNTAVMYDRPSTGAASTYQSASLAASAYPYWTMITRVGTSFTGYISTDGINWTQIGTSQTITMAQTVYVGLAVSSQSTSTLEAVAFDNVSVSTASAPAPVITKLSATTGSIGSQVTISGLNFGSSQGSSVVVLNGGAVTVNSWTATSIQITVPAGATSGPLVVSVGSARNNSNPIQFAVTTQPLPSPWLDQDIGVTGITGTATYSDGTFTINSAGQSIGGTADTFHFVYQTLSGDGTIVARVVSAQGGLGGAYGEAGVMIRETLTPGSTNAFISFSPNTAELLERATTGASDTAQTLGFAQPAHPYWTKITRTGNSFSGYISVDGINWTQIGTTQTITMATIVYVGLAVTSQSTSTLWTVAFDNVSINSTASPAPVITNLSATTGSIGSTVTVTGTNFGSSQGSSAVLLNGSPVTINSWTGTSISIKIPSGAVSGILVVAVGISRNDSNPVVFTVTANPLPSPWLDGDIGSVPIAGTSSYSTGTFIVNGSGMAIGGTADTFHFVYQPLSGNGTIVARVANIQSGTLPLAGVMIRETLTSGSTDAFVSFNPNTAGLQDRATTGANSTIQTYGMGAPEYPYWTKITRNGNVFSGFISLDGVYWTQIGTSQTITMASNVYAGLAVSAVSSSNLATVGFDNVTLTTGTPLTAPVVSTASPNPAGVGYPVTITGSGFGSTQGTSKVYFNSVPATVYGSWTNTSISATVPAGATNGPVSVVVNSLGSNQNVSIVVVSPMITSVTPPSAEVGGTVTINGSGFSLGGSFATVAFNGVAQPTWTTWSDTSISAAVPAGATSGPITVSLYGFSSPGYSFTVSGAISITGISPTTGSAGTTVTISGSGFGASQYGSSVSFNGLTAVVTGWLDNQIKVVVPVNAPSGPILVQVAQVVVVGPIFTTTTNTQVTDSKSNVTQYTSVMAGAQWYPLTVQGSGCSSCTARGNVSFTYDTKGNQLSKTDELGRVSTYTYDANGNILTSTVPITSSTSATTTYTYNSFGEVLTLTDPLNNVTTNTYDPKGNLLTVTTPAPGGGPSSSVTQFGYNSLGELTTITDPLNHLTTITYTTAGLINTIKDAQNNVTTYGYDTHGNRTSVTDALNHQTTFAYDAGDRLKTITYPTGFGTTTFTYDTRGRRTSVTDQNSKLTTYAYDDADRLTSVTDAANNVTIYAYDTENNLASIKDANLNTTSFTYDQFGRVTQTNFPSTHVESYGYDAVGNLTSKTDRKNQTITYTYDQLNRLTQKTYPDTTTVNYTYDNDSRLTQVVDPTGTYSFTFDNMGRLTNTNASYAFLTRHFTTAYSYDAASNRTGFTDPESGATSYVYDTLNRLQTLTPPVAYGTGNFGFTYDALSRRATLTRPNAVNTTYAYDTLSRLLSVTHAKSGTTLDGASYAVDMAGNRTSRTPLPGTTATNFTYDNIYELLTAVQGATTKETYTYDPVGNRLSNLAGSGWSNNTSNELTNRPGVTYTYDANGNTQSEVTSSGTTTFNWGVENQLTSVVLPASGGTVSFKYDPFGRRIYKSSTTGTSVYAYDGDNLIEETSSTGTATARYTVSLGIDEPLSILQGATTYYYENDGLGTITSLSNAAGGNAQTYTYDSFGNITASTGSINNRYRFTGREFDPETGLYYYRARYYDPLSGRFLVEDPLLFHSDSINLYQYAKNAPVNFRDPSGEFVPLVVLIPIVGGLVGGIADAVQAGPCESKLKAFGRGFASGALGTAAGLLAAVGTGNPWIIGAAAGEVSSIVDQALAGEPLDAGKVATSTLIGAVGGKILNKAFPTKGRLPKLTTPRTPQNFGPNSQRLVLQEFGSDALGGVLQYLFPVSSSPKCECN